MIEYGSNFTMSKMLENILLDWEGVFEEFGNFLEAMRKP